MLSTRHAPAERLGPFELRLRTAVVYGEGTLDRIGALSAELGFRRTLLVADPGLVAAGYVARTIERLTSSGIRAVGFHEFDSNPDTHMISVGCERAAAERVDSLVALGGGSSLDCAKGINFLLSGGGNIRDYKGYGKVSGPMLPSIAIPTTAGTGSEAQSYAIVSDADTHVKMACGDPKAAFRLAILDPALTVTQPKSVTAIAGYDAVAHAVEAYVTTKRNPVSDLFAGDAWRRLEANYERVLADGDDGAARGAMLLGAHEAGIAIEHSMLGATHACANPLTARYGTTHGVAIAVMLPHVVRWNAHAAGDRYASLLGIAGLDPPDAAQESADRLADRLEELAHAGSMPRSLAELGVSRKDLPELADAAAEQWTGTFNPRPFDSAGALALYERAF
jgi:alcohol dehydrogenase